MRRERLRGRSMTLGARLKSAPGSSLGSNVGFVSVLMLREGWDVRNVTVILGLRPFTSKADILPEQAVGRGLRLMRNMHPDYAQIVEIIGTPKFEDFVRKLETEGVGVGATKTPPPPGVHVTPLKQRSQYDLEIPRVSQTYTRSYKNLAAFDINTLPAGVVSLTGKNAAETQIDIIHGLTEVQVARRLVDFQPDDVFAEAVLAHITKEVIQSARLGCPFSDAYPFVREYVRVRFFGEVVDLASPVVARTLARTEVASPLVRTLAEALGKHTAEEQKMDIKPDPIRLSDTRAFIWRRQVADARKTIFNHVACFNQFEADFARFLDRADDVVAFAKLAEWFTGFALEYLSSTGAVRLYYPDFVAHVQDSKEGTMWLLETKGWEDSGAPPGWLRSRSGFEAIAGGFFVAPIWVNMPTCTPGWPPRCPKNGRWCAFFSAGASGNRSFPGLN
jgi:type III restriction enzyme